MFPIDTDQIITAAIIFLRVTGIIAFLPLFGEGGVPVRVRILLGVALTVGVYPTIPVTYVSGISAILNDAVLLTFLLLKEFLIGIVIGYLAKLSFDGIVMSSSIVGVQMGFNTSNIFLPDSDSSTNGFSALHRLLIVLIFLSLNLHYIYLNGISDSFKMIPLGAAWPSGPLSELMVKASSGVFLTALQLAAPTLVGLLFATAALGLISRAVPQANVFVLSFPISFFTGLIIYMAMLPMLPGWLSSYFLSSKDQLLSALAHMKP